VRYFPGIEGIKTVLDETLECQSKELRAVMSNSELFQTPGFEVITDVAVRRIRAGINLCQRRFKSDPLCRESPK
jgi:HTH-type transcriptional regulator, sugar sensing transcriptional regulator